VLVLDVKQWASTTRLAKALSENGLQVECKFPPAARLTKFLASWSKRRHGAEIQRGRLTYEKISRGELE
jgi:hypothetical protein